MECLPNRLTPLYSKIYYEEENYLKVRTELLIYPSPPHSKGLGMWEYSISVRHIPTFSCTHVLSFIMWLGYPSFYSSTGSISPASRILILNQYKSSFSTYKILFIKSITPTPFFLFLFLKRLFISKSLTRGILYSISI